ncbi:MAG: DNA polymerase III subunit beta [Acidobacteria bacterium]|nr:MAG: DNA polymerase III subunit beta [Acidobacteriota bacterium]REJ98355.1 MAG: DNA polymerase III subunit beta [Acidobacteriota bacterium]REK17099.1 MAG: DNA polymerase III subunit beta [Acidobacteriota bacterium]REK43009.1 MAG: DNA polymerase III subunit beta [Acidobacteriota bacterium]
MEFKIEQGALKEELGFVQGIVEKKSTIPVLSNILIESVGENTIRIIGTDLDVTIRCEAEAEIIEGGSMCLQARKIFDVVRLLPEGSLHFKKDDNDWVNLTCGASKYRFAGVSRDQFPEVPVFKSAPLTLPAAIFNHFIVNTSFAITNEQSRFTLSGAKFMIEEGTARMVTTDGYRLAYIDKDLPILKEESMDALIPKKALIELVKISRGTGGDVSFGEDQNHIYFEVDSRLLITRKLSGTFPNYEMVIPKDNDKRVEFNASEMKDAVARVSLMADERTRSVKLKIKEGEIEVTAHSSEEGEAVERIATDYEGPETEIGFNAQYLQDFLSVAASSEIETGEVEKETEGEKVKVRESGGSPRVSFEFKSSNGQVQMRMAGESDYEYQYVVMPLRI